MPLAGTNGLTRRLDSAILDSPHLKGCTLQVELRAGQVILQGCVGSYYQKQIAQEVIRLVEGVERIENRLVVNWSDPQRVENGTPDQRGLPGRICPKTASERSR